MIGNSQFFDDLHIVGLSVVSGVRPAGRSTDHSDHGRGNCGVLCVKSGEATFYLGGGKTLAATDGQLVFMPKGKRYRMRYTVEGTSFVVVNFDVLDRGGDVVLFDEVSVVAKDDMTHRIARIMTSFEQCGPVKTGGAILRKKELMYRLLGLILSSGSYTMTGREVDSKIADGVSLLEQTYLENLPVEQYAAASHVSINTFRGLFQKQFGTSPLKYRNRLRVERARELLSEGGFSVAEVAYASGFENIGYFCRCYRQITGEAPGATKKKGSFE